MSKEEEQKDFKKILNSKKSIHYGSYKQYLIHLTPLQIKTLKFYVNIMRNLNLVTLLNSIMPNQKTKKKYLQFFYLNIKLKILIKQKKNKEKYNLQISYIQLGETCPDIIKINNKIEYLKNKKVISKTTNDKNFKPNVIMREKLANLRLVNQKKK